MNKLLPAGFVSIRGAAAIIDTGLHAGKPETEQVRQLRSEGLNVGAMKDQFDARAEVWKRIELGKMKLHAFGGSPPRDIVLTPDQVKAVPFLTNPRVSSLSYLRPSHPLHDQFVLWFGRDLSRVALAVEEREVHRLIPKIMGDRRRRERKSQRGRPTVLAEIKTAVWAIIERGTWSPTGSQKKLAALVNRRTRKLISQTTVTRALDSIYKETNDRRFKRMRRYDLISRRQTKAELA